MSNRIKLKSGNYLDLRPADFEKSWALQQVLCNELKLVGIELDGASLETLGSKDVNTFKNVLFQLLGSKAVTESVFDCLAFCMLELPNQPAMKIVKRTFDDEGARPDFLPCVLEVVKLNVLPFFAHLDLSSLTSGLLTKPSVQP